jgi:hypothetical protein
MTRLLAVSAFEVVIQGKSCRRQRGRAGLPNSGHGNWLGSLVILLDDFQVQGSLVDSLEVGVRVFNDLLMDGLVKPGNVHLGLQELSSVGQRVVVDQLAGSISLGGLGHLVRPAGHNSLECFNITGKVCEDSFPWFLHEVLEDGTHSLGRVFLFKGVKKACRDSDPAGLVSPKDLQAVPPRLGLSLEDAGQHLEFFTLSQVVIIVATLTCMMSQCPIVVSLVSSL